MVSNARDDLPDPLTPLTTVIALCGISTVTFFRLWTRAPRTRSVSCSNRPGVASGKVSCFSKGKPRQRVWRALSKLRIILRPVPAGKAADFAVAQAFLPARSLFDQLDFANSTLNVHRDLVRRLAVHVVGV